MSRLDSHPRDALADQPLDVTIETRQTLHPGFRALDALTVRHASIDGTHVLGPLRREILSAGSVAVIVPYDPVLDAIVVVRQFRIGAALKTPNAAAIELPAGLIDDGEAEEAGAARELLEETGLPARAIERCFTLLPSPGLTDEYAIVFLAIVDASALGASAGLAEEHEDIRPILAPVDALIEAVDAGRVENGFLIAGVHWFARLGRARAATLSASIRT